MISKLTQSDWNKFIYEDPIRGLLLRPMLLSKKLTYKSRSCRCYWGGYALDHLSVADSGGSLELGPANRAASTGVRNRKDTQRVRSNPQQSDPIQVGSDIQ